MNGLAFHNKLLSRLSLEDQALLAPDLERIHLPQRMLLEAPDTPISHAYFPGSGVGSTVVAGSSGRQIEVGLFGREGMAGTAIVMKTNQSPLETFMQVPGEGHRIPVRALDEAIEASSTLQRRLLRYVQAQHIQITQTAVSNGYGMLGERLARWLVMCHDRMSGDHLALTHEFLSKMLGVRRAGVTVALHELAGQGHIRVDRELIWVLDREGLVERANGSYGVAEREYRRLMAT